MNDHAPVPPDRTTSLSGPPLGERQASPVPNGDARARDVIMAFLDGQSVEITPGAYGQWEETVTTLHDAFSAGGLEGVRRAFGAVAQVQSDLIRLIAIDAGTKRSWTAAELLGTVFPEPRWAVPGIIPEGVTLLAGRPKQGKSWLALAIGGAVGTGGQVLGRRVAKGKVLFFALEDGPRRLKDRLQRQGFPSAADISFIFSWPTLSDGGLADLQSEIERTRPRVVIVDTFSRLVGPVDQSDMADMMFALASLQRLTQMYQLALILVDHHRKSAHFNQNPVDDIMGSTMKSAIADAALGLFREQGKRNATLRITGRDIEERDLPVAFDVATCCWRLCGEDGAVPEDSIKAATIEAIRQLAAGGKVPTTTSIAEHLRKAKSNVSRALGELVATGRIVRGEKVGRETPYMVRPESEVR